MSEDIEVDPSATSDDWRMSGGRPNADPIVAVGPIEAVRTEVRDGRTCIVEIHVGAYALLQRLAGSAMRRSLLRLFGGASRGGPYVVPWDRLDLTDPERPRLRCPVDALRRTSG